MAVSLCQHRVGRDVDQRISPLGVQRRIQQVQIRLGGNRKAESEDRRPDESVSHETNLNPSTRQRRAQGAFPGSTFPLMNPASPATVTQSRVESAEIILQSDLNSM